MTAPAPSTENAHRWYTRPVLFVADAQRAAHFYVRQLGFTKGWHADDGAGPVCQVNHGECEIILCEDAARRGHGRLYIELTDEALTALRGELAAHGVPSTTLRWGNDVTRVLDADGNELYFPHAG